MATQVATEEKPKYPSEVTVLTDTEIISGGESLDEYPTTINRWVSFEYKKTDKPFLNEYEWWGAHYHIYRWCCELTRRNDDKYQSILVKQDEEHLPTKLLISGRTLYNLIWAYLGYTEGQPSHVLELLEYIHSSPLFNELKEEQPYIPPSTGYRRGKKETRRKKIATHTPTPRKTYRSYLKK